MKLLLTEFTGEKIFDPHVPMAFMFRVETAKTIYEPIVKAPTLSLALCDLRTQCDRLFPQQRHVLAYLLRIEPLL